MSDVNPALTREEWAEFLDPENAEWAPTHYKCYHSDHGTAAACVHDQPFGFTRGDVRTLNEAAVCAQNYLDDGGHPGLEDLRDRCLSLADRIEALLPPEE